MTSTQSTHAGPAPAPRAWRPAPAVLLLVLWIAAFPWARHYGNPDGPAYASVAELWATGQWATAVNAYWGPLLSWLAAPLVAVGVDPLLALRLVLLAGALLVLPSLRGLCRRAGASERSTYLVLLAVAPFLVYAALFGLYADVLMAAALLRSLDLLTRPAALGSSGPALRAGAWAGVAFLARAYAAPVALIGLPLVVVLHRWSPGHRGSDGGQRMTAVWSQVGRAAAISLAGFLLVAGAWSAVLSLSYGQPTWSTSAGFNAELVAPGAAGNPYNVPGLHPPPREGAVSAWEEPSRLPVPRRADAAEQDARDPLAHRVELAVANARIVAGSVLRRGAPFALLAAVALVVAARRRQPLSPALVGPLVVGLVFVVGLVLLIAIERYTWTPILTTVPAAAVGLDAVLERRDRWWPAIGGGLLLVLLATSTHGLAPRFGAMEEVTIAAEALDRRGGLDGWVAAADRWQETHLLCYRVGCQYVGRPTAGEVSAAADELHGFGADHLVVWEGDEGRIAGLEVAEGPGHLTVHEVTANDLPPALRVGHDVVVLR